MKNLNNIILALVVLMLAACGTKGKDKTDDLAQKHPNVLFIAVDDLNNWLGCLKGYSNTKTPNIDKLASQGVLFSNAHCQAPLCGPSRASIMTGLRPSTTGIYGMIPDDKARSENPATKDIVFLPEYFRNHGYHTMGIGKLFHIHSPEGMFDESGGRVKGFGPLPEERFVWDGFGTSDRKHYGRTSTDWGAYPEVDSLMPDHQSVDWVIERLNRKYDQSFFMGLGFLRPHVPLYVPQKWFDMHPIEGIEVPPYQSNDLDDVPPVALRINDLPMMPTTEWAIESGEWKNIIQAYLACVSFVDYEIGRVMEALENSEYADNTVIVLWSDHGYRLGEKGTFAKHALWEPATNAPLMFVAPNLPKGKVIDAPAEMLSIYPTLLKLCGLPAYERNEGKSLVPTMLNENTNEDSYAITTFGMNNHAVKSDRFRYIQYEDGGEEFYDHNNDPNEWINQANNSDYQGKIAALNKYMPATNANWDPHSSYTFQPYFVEQKARTNSTVGKAVEVNEINPPAGRIAIVADGNSPDPDDLGATAVSIALLRAAGLERRLVHYSHSCDLVKGPRISEKAETERHALMQSSCDVTARRWEGFESLTFYDAKWQKEETIKDLCHAINASTADDPLWIVEAGEPDIIGFALDATPKEKHKYIKVVTHHPANDNAGDFYEWQQILDFGVEEVRIPDQNIKLKVDIADWDWAKNHPDSRIQQVWLQGKIAEVDNVVQFQKGKWDCSDAGMVLYWITGATNGGLKQGTVEDVKALLLDYVARNPEN